MSEWQYIGDINPEYGGCWFKVDAQDWGWGYMDCVRVTDLDSAIGFTGAVQVEALTVIRPRNRAELKSVLGVCGWTVKDIAGNPQMLAEACVAYGLYDPANTFPGPQSITLQLEPGGPIDHDGWVADKRYKGDLEKYVKRNWLH